jgi:two-component system CheB/CheR fusion protein
VKSANSAFYKTFKVFEEETEGRYIYELGNGQWNIAKLKELLHEIIPANTQFFGFNVSNHFPGIGEKFLTLNARKLVQRTHGQEVILLAIEDVTQHIIAKKVLEEQELWMRHMADNVPAMIWICDQHKQISFCNKSWLEYRGLAKEEAFQKEWLFGIHPDDFEKESEKFEISFSKKQPFVMQYRVKRADGEYFWLLTHAKPFYSNDGHFDGYIGSCIELLDQASGKLE